jgi:hypothetical protein
MVMEALDEMTAAGTFGFPTVFGNGMTVTMALALARHRLSRMTSVVDVPRRSDSWKVAGRIRTLYDS